MPIFKVRVPVTYYADRFYSVEADTEEEAVDNVCNGIWDSCFTDHIDTQIEDGDEELCDAEIAS